MGKLRAENPCRHDQDGHERGCMGHCGIMRKTTIAEIYIGPAIAQLRELKSYRICSITRSDAALK